MSFNIKMFLAVTLVIFVLTPIFAVLAWKYDRFKQYNGDKIFYIIFETLAGLLIFTILCWVVYGLANFL